MLDHILDKGIVIDAWVRVSLVGIDLITVEARVIVASIETYLNCADAVTQLAPARTSFNRATFWQQPRTPAPGMRGPVAADFTRLKH